MHKAISGIVAIVGLISVLSLQSIASWADDAELEAFEGHFKGSVTVDDVAGEVSREIEVTVVNDDDGNFHVEWSTTILHSDGERKATKQQVHFRPSEIGNIYGSAMRKNMFGRWVPLDPLKGDPYIWARLKGRTLTVYAMIIIEDGGYEMQQYDRTLRDDGNLDLVFTRVRNGAPLRTITGVLERLPE